MAGELYHLPGLYEPFSAVSHLVGAGLFVLLGVLLLRRGRGDARRTAYLGVYAAACVLLFSMSALFHMTVEGGTAHRIAERLDHAAIFVLIAASFTPGLGLLFDGPARRWPLALLWGAALAGVAVKTVYFESVPRWLGLALYLGLGWVGALPTIALWRRYGFGFVAPLIWGGVAYSVGGAMNLAGWPKPVPGVIHAHEVFHLTVIAGALFHWRFIWSFADGRVPTSGGVSPNRPHRLL